MVHPCCRQCWGFLTTGLDLALDSRACQGSSTGSHSDASVPRLGILRHFASFSFCSSRMVPKQNKSGQESISFSEAFTEKSAWVAKLKGSHTPPGSQWMSQRTKATVCFVRSCHSNRVLSSCGDEMKQLGMINSRSVLFFQPGNTILRSICYLGLIVFRGF